MAYIIRKITNTVLNAAKYFPVIVITGPRQSGKSTFCENTFTGYAKYNLEDLGLRDIVAADPKAFIKNCGEKTIIDEVQHLPDLLSYIQLECDADANRQFILTGSSNFSQLESISQSLAGRAAVFSLLPLALDEVPEFRKSATDEILYKGLYPSVVTGKRPAELFYPNYYTTYVERDVRQLKNISDLSTFQIFMKMTASRVGTEFNASQIGLEIGMSSPTVRGWMSILQTSYIAFLLQPYYANINKRLTKTPKIYFYDTGLLCFLLGIENAEQLKTHPLRGAVFENLAVLELVKQRFNQGKESDICFYRENAGREVDIVRCNLESMEIFEVKSSSTFSQAFLKNLKYLDELLGSKIKKSVVVYDGETVLPTAVNIRNLTENF